MKTVRLITILIVAMLVLSAWTPSPAYARADAATLSIGANSVSDNPYLAAADTVKLVLNNKTGGTLYVSLVGARSYSFAATNQGKTRFTIAPGKYSYTVRSSACGGSISKTQNFKGSATLGPYYCNKR